MATDHISIVDALEGARLRVESEKNSLEELREALYAASKDVISSYRVYSRARAKVAERSSTRNLTRLAKSEEQLGTFIEIYTSAQNQVKEGLSNLTRVHDAYMASLYTAGESFGAKRAARMMDSYVRRFERFIDKVDESVACISSHYTLHINAEERRKTVERSQNLIYGLKEPESAAPAVNAREVAAPMASTDISSTVESAVERAIAELSGELEKKISETISTSKTAQTESVDPAVILDAADRIGGAAVSLGHVIAELDKVISDVGVIVDKCRTVVEMQRSVTREMQGIEVKQRLVNQDQTALIESQDTVFRNQKAISEKHAQIGEAQALAADAVTRIIESQKAIDASLKESIKVQKSLLGSNSKYIDKLNKKIEKSESLNVEDNDG